LILFGATGVFLQMKDALNAVWDVPPARKSRWARFLKARIAAFAIILGTGFLLVVSLLVSAALSGFTRHFGDRIFFFKAPAFLLNEALSFVVLMLFFALLYKLLPDRTVAWRNVWIGALITAALFAVGKAALGIYLGRTQLASGFGAAGSLA